MKENTARAKRMPSVFEAYLTIAVMLVIIGVGVGVLGMDLKMMLIVCTVFNTVMGKVCGYTWKEMENGIVRKITSMGGCFLILLGIGFLVGTFMMSGTLPVLVSWLAGLISPKIIILLSFVLCGILSICIGSSFAAMGTLGVVMFSVASVQGLPVGPTAAAVICGCWLGQYISPVADIVNCAASCSNITTNEYMKQMMLPFGISTGLTLVFFVVIGMMNGGSASAEALAGVTAFVNDVSANFNTSIVVILPLVVAIVLSLLKVNTIIVLFGSGFLALFLGVLLQGFDLTACIGAAYSGFSTATFFPDVQMTAELSSLLNRGGIFSMGDSVLFLLCALACVGTMDVIGVFDVVQRTLFRDTKNAGKLHLISTAAMLLFGLCTADPYPPAIVGPDLLKKPFVKAGYDPKKAAVVSMGCGLLTTMCLPWSFCAWYSGNIYGASIGQYFPYAPIFWLVPAVTLVLSFFNIGCPKLPADYAEEAEEV